MVHAEMAALVDAARRDAATQGLRLVANLFPCHNCTMHIVAAGLKEVIFLHLGTAGRDALSARERHGDPRARARGVR